MKKKLLLISFVIWLQTAKSIDEIHSTMPSKNKQAFFLISAMTAMTSCVCLIKTAWSVQQYLALKSSITGPHKAHSRVSKDGNTLMVSLNGIDRDVNSLLYSACEGFGLSCAFALASYACYKKGRRLKYFNDHLLDQNSASA